MMVVFLNSSNSKILVLLISLLVLFPSKATAGLTIADNGVGIERKVTIESKGQFRLVFEAADNWGIRQWYDLAGDPKGMVNLAHMESTNPNSEESGLFQQVWYGTSPNDPKLYIMAAKYDWPGSVKPLNIIEANPSRVIVETSGHPMLAAGVLDNLTVAVRYCIYPTGKILIRSMLYCKTDLNIKEWRNSVIGLRDPSFLTQSDQGKHAEIIKENLLDSSKNWPDDKWQGFRLDQVGYNSWEILGNSKSVLTIGKKLSGAGQLVEGAYSIASRDDRYGWVRATDLQNPYIWLGQKAKYLFEYWDPSTPEPYTNWTKASLMLVPAPSNPLQGKQFTHGWKGFKRFYYHIDNIALKSGETIIQQYYLQLGSKNSTNFPDLSNQQNAEIYANDYLSSHSIKIITGTLLGSGFDDDKGCYTIRANNNEAVFLLNGLVAKRIKPVFELTGISPGVTPEVSLNGKALSTETDYIWHYDHNGKFLVQFLLDIDSKSTISIQPNKSVTSVPLTSLSEKKQTFSPESSNAVITKLEAETLPTGLQRYAILCYSNDNPKISSWVDKRFAYKINGNKPFSPDTKWITYFNIYGTGSLSDYLTMKDFAYSNNISYEDMLLHSHKNFTSKVPLAFKEMDRFGIFEGRNGILKTKDSKSFEDLTAKAYKGTAMLSDVVYLGYEEPFAEINWEIEKKGINVNWLGEFWNGSSWTPLSISDETDGFSRNGRMAFIPPESWQPTSVNNSRKKYFVRLIIRDADTYPVSNRIFGDNWLNGSNNSCRGWDGNNAGIVNKGVLAFNPRPPSDASAKFRYQARITFWSDNHFVANPANIVRFGAENIRSWAKYATEEIINRAKSKGYSGVMCDDAEGNVVSDGVKIEFSDFPVGKEWKQESIAKYGEISRLVQATDPHLSLGANSQQKQLVRLGNWNLAEYNTFVWKTGSAGPLESNSNASSMAYDDYIVRQGEKDVSGVLIYQDTIDNVPGVDVVWDRANRGPLTALSKHYIGMNKNTVFSYYSRGGYIYSETDEVVLKNKKIVHQASEPTPRVEDVHRWATWFPAMGVDIGTPDEKGHIGGVRDTAWKKGGDIGGGPDVYRRDFTHAIVLHRPAFYNTTKAAYETYSNPIILEKALFPLRADGATEPATAQISLRAGDGAILLKNPIAPSQR